MEPAASIVEKFGGPTKVAAILGVHRTRVSNWTRPKEAGGSGGRIPQSHHLALLLAAREVGISLSAEDFIQGFPPVAPSTTEVAA